MTAKVVVTFEYESRPPDTWRGKLTATNPATILARGTRLAMKKYKPRNWTSCNAIIAERTGTVAE